MPILKAVIPAAGLGTRLYPATKSQPKEMLPLGAKPTIQYVAEELVAAGLPNILVVTGRQKRAIEDHFDPADGLPPGDGSQRGDELLRDPAVRFFYVRQSTPRGLGDAVAHAEQFVGHDPFVVALGDCVILEPIRAGLLGRMMRFHESHAAAATIAVQRVTPEDTTRYGIVAPAASREQDALRLEGIVEKPGPEHAPSDLAVCARYVFSPDIFSHLRATAPGHGGEIQLTDAIRSLISAGLPVLAVPLQSGEERLDVGNQQSYARAFLRVALADAQLGEPLRRYLRGLL